MAMNISRRLFAGSVLSLPFAAPALAHHGWSGFDSTRLVRLDGRIVAMTFDNPHGMLRLAAADGEWSVELSPPSRMRTRGLEPSAIAPGTPAVLEGYAHRETTRLLRAERIIVAGRTTELR
jgi:hypothetical protein